MLHAAMRSRTCSVRFVEVASLSIVFQESRSMVLLAKSSVVTVSSPS